MLKKELAKMILVSLPMVLTPAFNMIFLIAVARIVDVSSYGNLAYVLALISILVGFSDLGLRDYFLSKDGLVNEYSRSINLLMFSVFVFLLIFIFQYFFLVSESGLRVVFLVLIGEAFALGVLHKVIYHKYQSNNDLAIFSKCDSVFKVLPITIKILILYKTKDLVVAIFIGSVSTLLIYLIWLVNLKVMKGVNLKTVFLDVYMLCQNWRRWGVYTISFVSFFLYFGADRLVVEQVLGVERLAIYSAAMAFMAIGQIFVGVLWSLYMPRLSRGESIWSYNRFMAISCGVGALLVCAYLIFSNYFFNYIYPSEYADGAAVLALGSIYFLFRFPNVVMEIYYIIDGKYQIFVKMRVLFGLASLALSFILLPIVGIIGAALALVMSEMLLMISSLLGRRRKSC